jgi:hypothetical protein
LSNYTRAFETKDLKLLQSVRPDLKSDELQRYSYIWQIVDSYRVILKVEHLDIRDDTAEVKGRREDILIMKDGRRDNSGGERSFTFKLKRQRAGWIIENVN